MICISRSEGLLPNARLPGKRDGRRTLVEVKDGICGEIAWIDLAMDGLGSMRVYK